MLMIFAHRQKGKNHDRISILHPLDALDGLPG